MTRLEHKAACGIHDSSEPSDDECTCGAVLEHREGIIIDCQAILSRYLPPDGIDAQQALNDLLSILDGPRGLAVIGKSK